MGGSPSQTLETDTPQPPSHTVLPSHLHADPRRLSVLRSRPWCEPRTSAAAHCGPGIGLPKEGWRGELYAMERGRAGTDSSKTSASQVILDPQGPMCCRTGSRRETPRDSHVSDHALSWRSSTRGCSGCGQGPCATLRRRVGCTFETFEMRARNEMVLTTSPFAGHHGLPVPSVKAKS